MLGQIINAGVIISLFAIAAPFIFTAWILKMILGHDKKRDRRDRCNNRRMDREDNEDVEEISKGIKDLKKRIENLEIIKAQKKKTRGE